MHYNFYTIKNCFGTLLLDIHVNNFGKHIAKYNILETR